MSEQSGEGRELLGWTLLTELSGGGTDKAPSPKDFSLDQILWEFQTLHRSLWLLKTSSRCSSLRTVKGICWCERESLRSLSLYYGAKRKIQ